MRVAPRKAASLLNLELVLRAEEPAPKASTPPEEAASAEDAETLAKIGTLVRKMAGARR
jgi:hypothetical protein